MDTVELALTSAVRFPVGTPGAQHALACRKGASIINESKSGMLLQPVVPCGSPNHNRITLDLCQVQPTVFHHWVCSLHKENSLLSIIPISSNNNSSGPFAMKMPFLLTHKATLHSAEQDWKCLSAPDFLFLQLYHNNLQCIPDKAHIALRKLPCWCSNGERYAFHVSSALCTAAATEINLHIPVLTLPLAPDIKHDSKQDDASQRHEMCQLKRQPIQVVVLEIHIARDQQEIAGNANIRIGKRVTIQAPTSPPGTRYLRGTAGYL